MLLAPRHARRLAPVLKLSRCYGYSSFRENSPFSTEKRSTAIILLQYCTTTTALGTLLHFVHFFIWPKNNNKTICVYWMHIRYPSIFFDQVGHRITSACIENCQTYQNYEQPPQSLQNLYFQSHFSASKINRIFLIFFFCEEYLTRRLTFINEIVWNFDF